MPDTPPPDPALTGCLRSGCGLPFLLLALWYYELIPAWIAWTGLGAGAVLAIVLTLATRR